MEIAEHFANSSPEMLDRLDMALRYEAEKRQRENPVGWFPWHRIQTWLLNSPSYVDRPVRVILAAGGNRGGKTKVGMGFISDIQRRNSPINDQLITNDPVTGKIRVKNDTDPLNFWVIPPTLEKARLDWLQPSDQMGLTYWLGDNFVDMQHSPDLMLYAKPPGLSDDMARLKDGSLIKRNLDKIVMKSQDQKLLSFESSAVDVAVFDEEVQDEKKWNSVMLRLATNNGLAIMCYTPLHGLSWSYDRYWQPLIEAGRAEMIEERCWIHEPSKGSVVVAAQFGSADNPMAKVYAEEIEADPGMSEAEKAARLYGQYGFVEGSLVPALSGLDVLHPKEDHKIYVVDRLPGSDKKDLSRIFQWFLVADPNKSFGAVLGALDTEGNIFLVTEHLEESWPDRLHVEAFKKMEKRWVRNGPIRRMADPGSAGAHSIINMSDLGMLFETIEKGAGSVSDGVKQLRSYAWVDPSHKHPLTREVGAPRLYFLRPGMVTEWFDNGHIHRSCRTAQQISMARQTDNADAPPDTPHKSSKSKLDLFDCVRYLVRAASQTHIPHHVRLEGRTPANVLKMKDHMPPQGDEDFDVAGLYNFEVPDVL